MGGGEGRGRLGGGGGPWEGGGRPWVGRLSLLVREADSRWLRRRALRFCTNPG